MDILNDAMHKHILFDSEEMLRRMFSYREPVLSAIWRRIQDSGDTGCNEDAFRETAFEARRLSAYEDMMNMPDGTVNEDMI